MTTSSETKLGRLSYMVRVRREMIDGNERTIARLTDANRQMEQQLLVLENQLRTEHERQTVIYEP